MDSGFDFKCVERFEAADFGNDACGADDLFCFEVLHDEEICFASGLLEGPQYTRPESFRGWEVPRILLSGNLSDIHDWRVQQSVHRTWKRRPLLFLSSDTAESVKPEHLIEESTRKN